jgi:hypothetical protein
MLSARIRLAMQNSRVGSWETRSESFLLSYIDAVLTSTTSEAVLLLFSLERENKYLILSRLSVPTSKDLLAPLGKNLYTVQIFLVVLFQTLTTPRGHFIRVLCESEHVNFSSPPAAFYLRSIPPSISTDTLSFMGLLSPALGNSVQI